MQHAFYVLGQRLLYGVYNPQSRYIKLDRESCRNLRAARNA